MFGISHENNLSFIGNTKEYRSGAVIMRNFPQIQLNCKVPTRKEICYIIAELVHMEWTFFTSHNLTNLSLSTIGWTKRFLINNLCQKHRFLQKKKRNKKKKHKINTLEILYDLSSSVKGTPLQVRWIYLNMMSNL